jgi:hypothetical protein
MARRTKRHWGYRLEDLSHYHPQNYLIEREIKRVFGEELPTAYIVSDVEDGFVFDTHIFRVEQFGYMRECVRITNDQHHRGK